jgi:hypothetical protein
VEKGVEKEEE